MKHLIITIGPQCSGKTTYLAQLPDVADIAIDNMPGTYEQISVQSIIKYQETGRAPSEWLRTVYKRTLFDRLSDLENSAQLPLLLLFVEVKVVQITLGHVIHFSGYRFC
jgi:RNase adaptor protein for sRNA GlmZ degradation